MPQLKFRTQFIERGLHSQEGKVASSNSWTKFLLLESRRNEQQDAWSVTKENQCFLVMETRHSSLGDSVKSTNPPEEGKIV